MNLISFFVAQRKPKISYNSSVTLGKIYYIPLFRRLFIALNLVFLIVLKYTMQFTFEVFLQIKLECLPEVERAFVHLDYETDHSPFSEHKKV